MRIYRGYVKANGGDTPRPSNQIVYTVAIDFGGNVGWVDFQNVTPSGQRPDPTAVDAIPRPASPPYPFFATEEVPGAPIIVHFEENPAYAPCSSPASLRTSR